MTAIAELELESYFTTFKSGDQRAFRFFYEIHYNSLCIFANRMLNDNEGAADIVQEVFVLLWKTRENIASPLHLKMYLYQAVRHKTINYIRLLKKENQLKSEYLLLVDDASFKDLVVEEEVHRMVAEEINHLSEEQRRVIMLHLAGNSNTEIAEEMNVSINTVKTHKARARKKLKKKIDDLFILFILFGF